MSGRVFSASLYAYRTTVIPPIRAGPRAHQVGHLQAAIVGNILALCIDAVDVRAIRGGNLWITVEEYGRNRHLNRSILIYDTACALIELLPRVCVPPVVQTPVRVVLGAYSNPLP